jgi:hypothetical protein
MSCQGEGMKLRSGTKVNKTTTKEKWRPYLKENEVREVIINY